MTTLSWQALGLGATGVEIFHDISLTEATIAHTRYSRWLHIDQPVDITPPT